MREMEIIKEPKRRRRFRWELYLGFIFFALLLFIGYTSFYNPDFINLTGNLVKEESQSEIIKGVALDARLDLPQSLLVESVSQKVSMRVSEPATLLIGNQKVSLSSGDSVVIDNFEGTVSVKGRRITAFDGKGTKVFVNGLPISSKSDDLITLNAQGVSYSSLTLQQVYLDSFSYVASGQVEIDGGKLVIQLDKENFNLAKFKGDMVLTSELRMQGVLDRSSVVGLLERYQLEELRE